MRSFKKTFSISLLVLSSAVRGVPSPSSARGGLPRPAGVALLRRVGRGRRWLSIPPHSAVEGFLSVARRNFSGLPSWSRLMPPADFAETFRVRFVPEGREVACLIRSPQERIEGELRRRCHEERRCNRAAELKLMDLQAKLLLRVSRPITPDRKHNNNNNNTTVPLNLLPEVLHMLPQTWYVWGRKGRVTCHCLLSHANLERVALLRRASLPVLRHGSVPWSASLARLYVDDALLHRNVSARLRQAPPATCYRPVRR